MLNKTFKILGVSAVLGAIGFFVYKHFYAKSVENNSNTGTDDTDTKGTDTNGTSTNQIKPKKKVTVDKAKESVVKTNGYDIVKLRDDYKQGGYKTYNESFATLGDWAMFSEYCKAEPCILNPQQIAVDGQIFIVDEMYSIDFGKFKGTESASEQDLGTRTFAILNKQKNPSISSLPNGVYAIPLPAFFDTKSVSQLGGDLNPSQLANTNPLIRGYLDKATKEYNSFIQGKGWDGSYDVETPNFYIPTNVIEGQIAREARQAFNDSWRQKYGVGGNRGRCFDPSTGQYGDCVGDHTLDIS